MRRARWRRAALALACALCVTASSAPAHAQDGFGAWLGENWWKLALTRLSTTSAGVVCLAAVPKGGGLNKQLGASTYAMLCVAIALPEFVTTALTIEELRGLSESKDREATEQALFIYLRANRRALAQEVALGGGPLLDDVALLLGTPREEHAALGQAARRHHGPLIALLTAPTFRLESARAVLALLEEHSRLARR